MKGLWLTYGRTTRIKGSGCFIFITDAKISDPPEHRGVTIWRYALSKRADQKDLHALWRDRNPRGRKIDTRFFTDRESALEAAKDAARTF